MQVSLAAPPSWQLQKSALTRASKVFPIKPDDLTLIPEHAWWKERLDSHKLSSDLHTRAVELSGTFRIPQVDLSQPCRRTLGPEVAAGATLWCFFKRFLFIYLFYGCFAYMYVSVHSIYAWRGQGPLRLESRLWAFMWVLGIEPESSAWTASALHCLRPYFEQTYFQIMSA